MQTLVSRGTWCPLPLHTSFHLDVTGQTPPSIRTGFRVYDQDSCCILGIVPESDWKQRHYPGAPRVFEAVKLLCVICNGGCMSLYICLDL